MDKKIKPKEDSVMGKSQKLRREGYECIYCGHHTRRMKKLSWRFPFIYTVRCEHCNNMFYY